MAKLKTKILLEMIDIITEYPNTHDFIQRKLIEKCDGEGISIDEVSLEAKKFFSRLSGAICFMKAGLIHVYQKWGLAYVY